jgi:hypothetical protein
VNFYPYEYIVNSLIPFVLYRRDLISGDWARAGCDSGFKVTCWP